MQLENVEYGDESSEPPYRVNMKVRDAIYMVMSSQVSHFSAKGP